MSWSRRDDAEFGGATLVLLSCRESQDTDRRFTRVAEMWGVRVVALDSESLGALPEILDRDKAGRVSLAASACSLAGLDQQQLALLSSFPSALFYGFDGSTRTNALLSRLTGSADAKTVELPGSAHDVSFSADLSAECEPLRGLGFQLENSGTRWKGLSGLGCAAQIRIGPFPLVAKCELGSTTIFLLAGSELLDVDAPARSDLNAEVYLRLAPWLMFLRSVYGEWCWHNPHPQAAWTIDDPLLKTHYGFLRYGDLMAAMDAGNFTASIAFIPWNCDRNSNDTIELFQSREDRLSICLHGCDHTEGEFCCDSPVTLRAKARMAMARMEHLRLHHGLAYQPIMVFPQGGFCRAASDALAAEGYLAALNTSVFARDVQQGDVSVGDLLDIAISSYGRCPLFSRRYPVSIFPLAFDLFVGKPALLVEHHGFFRNGCAPMTDFVRRLNAQSAGLRWSSPGEIFSEAALYQKTGDHETRVRFYTNHFRLQNTSQDRTTFKLHRTGQFLRDVSQVFCDTEPIAADISDSRLKAEVTLPPGRAAHIEVISAPFPEAAQVRFSAVYRARVAARRYLSEFRDNYLARNERLLALSKKATSRLLSQRRGPMAR